MDLEQEAHSWKKVFWCVSALSIGLKLLIATKVPLTGDEAYYVMWGKYPALGYYDQPPMMGWILAIMRQWGTSPVILRLPVIFLSSILAPFLVDLLLRRGRESSGSVESSRLVRAYLGGALFLIAPIHFLLPILSTDVPLVLFSFFSFYFFYRSIQEDRKLLAAFGGLFFGLAFLSKYFVILLGLSFFAYALGSFRSKKVWKMLGIGILSFLPSLALHLYWNSSHCWVNLVFNTVGRNVGETENFSQVIEYIKFQLILIGPVGVYYLFRSRKRWVNFSDRPLEFLGGLCFFIPLLVFGLSSFKFRQGLHWTLSFYPFFYLVIASVWSEVDLKSAFRWTALLSGASAASVLVLISLSPETWREKGFYPGLKMYLAAPALSHVLESYQGEYLLAADGYTEAALLEAAAPVRVRVFGEGVLFGRQDDLLSDFRSMNGKNVLVFTRHAKEIAEYQAYFETIEKREVNFEGRTYRLFLGHQFKYPVYRNQILSQVRRSYYSQSCRFLGVGECAIISRYFDDSGLGPNK